MKVTVHYINEITKHAINSHAYIELNKKISSSYPDTVPATGLKQNTKHKTLYEQIEKWIDGG